MKKIAEKSRKAAFLVENGFSEIDFLDSSPVLEKEGFFIKIISAENETLKAWNCKDWTQSYAASARLGQAYAWDYDVLVIPGGRRSVEKLKLCPETRAFIGAFISAGQPVIAYNYALELLLSLGLLSGHRVAAPVELAEDIGKAGGVWSDKPAVASAGFLTLTRQESGFSVEIRSFLKKVSLLETADSPRASRISGKDKAA
ncbi:MAG: DJ-1/PfpI family protein [Rhodospirillales bacterium]|nr:DJ-1/PfpI family protein [Alphaproteobacteria bacterium]MCB1839839.1 DJ-1/PfpI family protein [Alphaproteobacteria bacterium]MCB9976054.1 DJ-1/PfpI family protein [Rhodospirillales bacterium]